MKILLINQVFYPDMAATAQQITDLAQFLKKGGAEVTVVAGRRAYENPKQLFPSNENYEGIQIRRVHSTGLGKGNVFARLLDGISFEILLCWRLLWLPRQDIVVAFTSPPLIGFFSALYCKLRGGRMVQWLMDINTDSAIATGYVRKGSWLARLLTTLFRKSLVWTDEVIVLDRWMKEHILSYGVPAEKISIIPPWPATKVTPPLSRGVEKTNSFRETHGLKGKFVILYSGNHSVVHPLDTLLDAAVKMKENKDVVFLFIGSGLRVQDVKQCIQTHQLTNALQLPFQPREKLGQSLACADLHVVVMGNAMSGLVHTSKIYGILATGKPYVVIGPTKSHLVDVLEACPYGYHVEHGDVEGLIKVIERARKLSEKELREFEQKNVEFVTRHYGLEKSLQIFTDEVLRWQRKPEEIKRPSVASG